MSTFQLLTFNQFLDATLSFALLDRGFFACSLSSGMMGLRVISLKGEDILPKKSFVSSPSVFPVFMMFFTIRSSNEC